MRIALRAPAAVLALAFSACGGGEPRTYQNNDLQLVTGYTAKELCSCLFVMERDEVYCRAWTKANPAVASARIDREGKTVQAGAVLLWGAQARYVDVDFGCVLE